MQLNLRVLSARNVPKIKLMQKTHAFCIVNLENRPVMRTKVGDTKESDHEPIWNEEFHLPLGNGSLYNEKLIILLKHDDTIGLDVLVSRLSIPLAPIQESIGRVFDQWFKMVPVKSSAKDVEIHLQFQVAPTTAQPFRELQILYQSVIVSPEYNDVPAYISPSNDQTSFNESKKSKNIYMQPKSDDQPSPYQPPPYQQPPNQQSPYQQSPYQQSPYQPSSD